MSGCLRTIVQYALMACGLLYANATHAIVDMRNGNFANTWVDARVLGGEGVDAGNACNLGASTARTYNSKSTHDGLFGFGWCSGLESTIRPGVQSLVYSECGAGQEVEFKYTSPLPLSDIGRQADGVVRSVQRFKGPVDPSEFNNFQRDLVRYTDLREKFLAAYGQSVLPRIPAHSLPTGQTAWLKGDQARIVGPATIREFRQITDRGVRRWVPTAMDCRDGRWWTLDWSDEAVIRLDSHVGPSTFQRTPEGRIRAIEQGGDVVTRYEYQGAHLVKVTNSWGNSYAHRYDAQGNMVRANYPDGTSIQLDYDAANDRVTRFTDREGCTEDYRYPTVKRYGNVLEGASPSVVYSWLTTLDLRSDRFDTTYAGLVRKACQGTVTNRSVHAFGYEGASLSEVESVVNGTNTFVRYDATERPRQFFSARIPVLSSVNQLTSARSGAVSNQVSNRLFRFRAEPGTGLTGTVTLFGKGESLLRIALVDSPEAAAPLAVDWVLGRDRGQLRLERQDGEIKRVTTERGEVVLDSQIPPSTGDCFPLVPEATVATWSARFSEALSSPRDCAAADLVLTALALSVNHELAGGPTGPEGSGRLTGKEAASLYASVIGPVPSDPDYLQGFDAVMDEVKASDSHEARPQ